MKNKTAEQMCKEVSESFENLSKALAYHAWAYHHDNYDELVSEIKEILENYDVTFKSED